MSPGRHPFAQLRPHIRALSRQGAAEPRAWESRLADGDRGFQTDHRRPETDRTGRQAQDGGPTGAPSIFCASDHVPNRTRAKRHDPLKSKAFRRHRSGLPGVRVTCVSRPSCTHPWFDGHRRRSRSQATDLTIHLDTARLGVPAAGRQAPPTARSPVEVLARHRSGARVRAEPATATPEWRTRGTTGRGSAWARVRTGGRRFDCRRRRGRPARHRAGRARHCRCAPRRASPRW